MDHAHENHGKESAPSRLWLYAAMAVIAFYLLTEHRQHLMGFLPYAIVLLCPLMHLFMHRGHGSHGGRDEPR